jgi:hypothetical protein
MRYLPCSAVVLFLASILLSQSVAQTPPAPYVPKQSDRPLPIEGDEPGFELIFDGRTLSGWKGDPNYWRVEDGALVGEITPATVIKSNTFIIWQGAKPQNFELKLEYRISAEGNSGINYRSAVIPDPVTPSNAFAMRGYQFDIDGKNRYTGNNYEEKGRLFLALRGQMTRVVGGRPPVLLSTFESPAPQPAVPAQWNSVHLIVRDRVLIHALNGQLMCTVIDDDAAPAPLDGAIAVQVHTGPPMKVEYRNIRLKVLPAGAR